MRLPALLVFLTALGVRLAYFGQIRTSPLTDVLLIDSHTYDRFAWMILDGAFHGELVYSMNILYPYFLAAVYGVFGAAVQNVIVVQAVLDSLSCVLVLLIGARAFDRRTGILAGVLAAVYGPAVFYTGALLTPTLINLFCFGSLALLLRYRTVPRPRTVFLAGLLLGLAALGRGNSILLLPLSLPFFRLETGRWAAAWRPWGIFAAGALVLLALVGIRNTLVEKQFVPVSANYAAFYIGHNPDANGLYTMPDFVETAAFEGEVLGAHTAIEKRLGRELTLAESARYLFGEGWRYITEHPGDDLKLTSRKLFYFFNDTESPTNLSYYLARDFSPLLGKLRLGFGLVVPFGLLGMILARLRWREHLILYLYSSVYLITCLVFFVSAEYRMPVTAVLLVFSAHAVIRLVAATRGLMAQEIHLRMRSVGVLTLSAFILLPLTAAVNHRTPLLRAQALKRVDYFNFGTLYRNAGDLDRAAAMLERSLAIDPAYPPANAQMAEVERLRGNAESARRYAERYRRVIQPDGNQETMAPRTRRRLQVERLYLDREYDRALEGFRELDRSYRDDGEADLATSMRNNVGLCLYKLDRYAEAERTFRTIIEEQPGYVRAHTNLGLVLEATSRFDEAVAAYEAALEIEPGNLKALRALRELTGEEP